jgi:tetratricopeptide (TPR) repeat protein
LIDRADGVIEGVRFTGATDKIERAHRHGARMRTRGVSRCLAIVAAALLWPLVAASQRAPQDSTELYNAGIEHTAAGRWQAAIEIFKQAIAKDAKDADAHFQLGHAYLQTGQFDDALRHFKQAAAWRTSLSSNIRKP